ncbi:MFS transporter [Salininema proteolyticum]|uniref:MFS transporter n=1 Tax=Salininema proteolyticum TaxID=1607685 RepID=A0ABV8TV22_9ACTN
MTRTPRALSPYTLYLLIEGVTAFAVGLVYTTIVLYRVQDAGLSPLQVVLVGTVLEAAFFLVHVPTGLLADTVSRKRFVTAGLLVLGVGFTVEGLVPAFAAILVAQILCAAGFAFMGGALEAWAADEIPPERLDHAVMRAAQLGMLGTLAGALLSGVTAAFWTPLPFHVAGALFVLLGVLTGIAMREGRFRARRGRVSGRELWASVPGDVRRTARNAASLRRTAPLIGLVFAVSLFFGLYSEGWDRLSQVHLTESFEFPETAGLSAPVWLSLIVFAATLAGLGATEIVRRRLGRPGSDPVPSLLVLTAVVAASAAVFGVAGGFLVAVAVYCLSSGAKAAVSPAMTAWTMRNSAPESRATVLSTAQSFDSLGQVAGGPAIGLVGERSLRAAMVAAAALLLPAAALLVRALRRRGAERQGEAAKTTIG